MLRHLLAAAFGATIFAVPLPAAAQEIRPLVKPEACNFTGARDEKAYSGCRAALSAIVQAEPENHLARLSLADMNYHLDDDASVALDINAVRSRVTPEQFLALIAVQKDFVLRGASDCRLIVHDTQGEMQWRGPCVAGFAEGQGMLLTGQGRYVSIETTTFKGGAIAAQGNGWGARQALTGAFEYWRSAPGVRARLIKIEAAPAPVRPLLQEATQAIPTQPLKARIEGTITATNVQLPSGWHLHCYTFGGMANESFHLDVKTPGRQALVSVQPGDACNGVTWQLDPRSTRQSAAGAESVGIDVTLGGGMYAVAIASSQPGPYIYTRERIAGGGGASLAAGLPPRLAAPIGTASTSTYKAERTYKPGEVIRDCPSCPEMVVLPEGSFMIGSPATEEGRQGAEGPRRQITFKRAFAIGKYEVTFDEWNACVAAGACAAKADNGWGQGRRPVINVTYDDAHGYVAWLTKTSGYNYYLPSEAEWEYAARAGTDTPWNTGDGIITDDANILNAFGRTTPVGGFPANAFGLHDVHGNVAEMVQDCFDVGYFDVPADGSPKRVSGQCNGIMRGGNYGSEPAAVRSAARAQLSPAGPALGFRITRLLD